MTRHHGRPPEQELRLRGSAHVDVPEASGLAWDPKKRVLLAVGDEKGFVYEIRLGEAPQLVGTTKLRGQEDRDLEGIALSPDGEHIWVTAEKRRRILSYDRGGNLDETIDVHIEDAVGDDGLEGIAIDPSGRVFVVHERKPVALLELDADRRVANRTDLPDLADLSGICVYDGSIWVVSDQSKSVARLDPIGTTWRVGAEWSIGRRHAEGIEVVDDLIYIVFDVDDDRANLAWYDLPER